MQKIRAKYWYWIWKTFLGPSRLRKKFVRTFILSALVPLLFLAGVSVYLVNLTHRIDVEALEKNLTQQVALEVKKITDQTIANLELAVSFEEFRQIELSQQEFLLTLTLKNNPSLKEASFICMILLQCPLGKETTRLIFSENGPASSQDLRDFSQSPEFLTARIGGNYFGPVKFENGNLTINIATPVFNKKGEVINILSAVMSLDPVQTIARNAKLGETGYVYIINDKGKIIAHPDLKLIGRDVSDLPVIKDVMAEKDSELALKTGTYTNFEGTLVSGARTAIPDLNWGVIAEWPREETQSLIRAILLQFGLFGLITIILIAIIASLVALKLIQPIAQLRQGTSVIGGGNFDYRVNIKTGDELEDLAFNLNKMAQSLKGLEQVRELKLRTDLLSESLRKEQELSRLKDQFITTVSHQFNTPLSVINWALEPLGESKLNTAKIRESAKIIYKSQRDIVAIVNDLLTLSEIGFVYQKSKTKTVDVADLINKVIESFKEIATAKKIGLNFKSSLQNSSAQVNEFTMRKVFENLIDNAIAYSHENNSVEMSLEGDAKELTFKITDSGIGIPKNDQPSIFQQFFRAKNATMKKNVGTGLGLFITKNIIEGHGGKINFESEENKGSAFSVAIPRS